ncbi:MAG: hypothetical protein ABIN94_14380 [Ferruginibacter sp.]
MNKEYERIDSFIEKLKLSGKIRLDKSEFRFFNESVNETSLARINDIKISPSIVSFFRQVDFVNLQWYAADNADLKFMNEDLDFVQGSLVISTFSALIENILNKNGKTLIDPYHNLGEEDYASLVNYFPFDLLNGNGAACFKLENGSIADKLYYISIGNESFIKPLQVGIKSYLDEGYKNYFFNDWQKAVFSHDVNCKTVIDFYLRQLKQ